MIFQELFLKNLKKKRQIGTNSSYLEIFSDFFSHVLFTNHQKFEKFLQKEVLCLM